MTAIDQNEIKHIVIKSGADLFGIAPIDRFDGAPKGFHPIDISKNYFLQITKYNQDLQMFSLA
jgi:hypothetical protein